MKDAGGNLLGSFPIEYLNVGSLGYATGGALGGTCEAVRTDVGGGYRRNVGETHWVQLIDPANIPGFLLTDMGPGSGSQSGGVWEIDIAKSDENIWWMFFRGRALRSANKGVTWADTAINGSTGLYMAPNGGTQRLVANKCAIDPANADVVYCGSQRDGLWRYMSGSWSQIVSVPAATPSGDGEKIMIIAVDPTSSTVGSGATLRRSVVYVASAGNGIYRSTDGGTTFSLMSGHPGAGGDFTTSCMQIASTGALYLCVGEGANNLWRYSGGAWTNLTYANNIKRVFVDPKNTNRLVGMTDTSSARPIQSLDAGATWSLWNNSNMTATISQVPIIGFVAETQFRSGVAPAACCILPHPVDARDYIFTGIGVFRFASNWTTPPTTKSLNWIEDSSGIEELVAHSATVTPKGVTLLASHDKAIIRHPGGKAFPPACYPPYQLTNGYAVDWAIDNPDFLVCRVIKGGDYSGYSSNGGLSWTPFASSPTSSAGGTIAISNSNQIVVAPGQNRHPRYSTDNGATWNLCTFTGVTLPAEGSASGFGFGSTDTRRHILCADKSAPGVFYIYSYGASGMAAATKGLWKSTDGGATFNRVNSGDIINPLYSGYHVVLKCEQGVLYLSSGEAGSSWLTNASPPSTILKSTDGGVTFAALADMAEVTFGFGKPPAGSSISTMYMLGFKSGIYGLYVSYNRGDTITLLEPYSQFLEPYCITGDPTRYGRVIIGLTAGWIERFYDYKMRLS